MLNTITLCQNLAKVNGFWDIFENLMSDPYVLFLVTAAMFSTDQKSKKKLCEEYTLRNNHTKFQIHSVVSEEKNFFKMLTMTTAAVDDDDGRQVTGIALLAFSY